MSDDRLFDVDAGEAAKKEAMARVNGAASATWKYAAQDSVRQIAARRSEFTTDAVWWWLDHHYPDEATHEPRAMGPVMRWAVSEGLVIPTGRTVKSQRAACHRRPLMVWQTR